MRGLRPLLLALLVAAKAAANPAYVTDELVLGVYPEQNSQGQRLATLHSGASVETLGVSGEFTQVRLNDGTTGWVKSAYLTTQVPASVRVKQLQEELDQSHATTPALAEAAARSEVQQLKRELQAVQSDLDAARAAAAAPAAAPGGAGSPAPGGALAHNLPATPAQLWTWGVSVLFALACGFWLGYASLARRIRQKFGGIKVY
ncbi:MAG TPA: TIGR04211 family SH3 domain-containing protein [Steroidobacteraceae bacterium]|nr:TIGR04211 family SH3 domain-containing protein [Steroidobacteraceae bacterium]